MAEMEAKKIVCTSCGAEFDDTLAMCPYCGSLNYKGAEAEYLGKLEGVRQDMQQLEQVPLQELRERLKKRRKFVLKIFSILAVLAILFIVGVYALNYTKPRDKQADYLWEKENFPVMDQMYKDRDFAGLVALYIQAVEDDRPVMDWEHNSVLSILLECDNAEQYLADEGAGRSLQEYEEASLLFSYWRLKGMDYSAVLTEKEREYLRSHVEGILVRLEGRYTFTPEEEKKFEDYLQEHYGYPDYDYCKEYIAEHFEHSKAAK